MPLRTSAAASARSATRSARLMIAASPRLVEPRPELVPVDDVAVLVGVADLAHHHLDRHADGELDPLAVGELAGDQRPLVEAHHADVVRGHGGVPARGLQNPAERVERAAPGEDERPQPRSPARRADGARREVPARTGRTGAALQPVIGAAQPMVPGELHLHTCRMWVTATDPEPPTLCAMPIVAPRTWAGPASPRSCSTVSTT